MAKTDMREVLAELTDEYAAHVSDLIQYCQAYEDAGDLECKARLHSVACNLFMVPWGKVAEILDSGVDGAAGLSDLDRQGVEWFAKLCRGDVDLADHADHGYDISNDEDGDDG